MRNKIFICITFIYQIIGGLEAADSDYLAEWSFPTKDSSLTIFLYDTKDGEHYCLKFHFDGGEACLKDDVDALTSTFKNMAKMGISPKQITGIYLYIHELEVEKCLAVGASKSGWWEHRLVEHEHEKIRSYLKTV